MAPMALTMVPPRLHRRLRRLRPRRLLRRLSRLGLLTALRLRHRIQALFRMILILTLQDLVVVAEQLPLFLRRIPLGEIIPLAEIIPPGEMIAHHLPAARGHSVVFGSLVLRSGASLFGDTDLTIQRSIRGGLILALVRA